jgi:hypothetical protein
MRNDDKSGQQVADKLSTVVKMSQARMGVFPEEPDQNCEDKSNTYQCLGNFEQLESLKQLSTDAPSLSLLEQSVIKLLRECQDEFNIYPNGELVTKSPEVLRLI